MGDVIVCKYGGTSVDSPEDIDIIRKVTSQDLRRKVIVVSAPAGVTDLLIGLVETGDASYVKAVSAKFQQAHPERAYREDIEDGLVKRLECGLPADERKDYVKAFGEYTNAKLIADSLGYRFMDSEGLLVVSGRYGDAEILADSRELVRRNVLDGNTYVVPGFYGKTASGRIATFSRGGSDLTGAYLAAALDVVVYENFTDRPGVFTADPKVVAAAVEIPLLTFKEMRDLAYSGAKIFHPDAILPIEDRLDHGTAIKVHIRSAKEYPLEGTYIVSERTSDMGRPVVGIAYGDSFCSFDINMRGLNNITGVAARITRVFGEQGISIEHITTGIDDLSVILKKDQLEKDIGRVSDVRSRLKSVLGSRAEVDFQEHMGCLVVAGKGIKNCSTSLTIRMLQALVDQGIDTIFTEMGPSKSCIISGIPSRHKNAAMCAVHREFFEKSGSV
jgi:aspartate kinase